MRQQYKYIIFGSETSLDLDILIIVPYLNDTIEENKDVIKHLESKFDQLKIININKPININLAVLDKGVLIDVFKGTVDEVNNSIYNTFGLHDQMFRECPITRLLKRDVELKILRCFRIILSYLSRTSHRKEIKKALKGNIHEKINILKKINLTLLDEECFKGKSDSYLDIIKTIAFQLGQTKSLIEGNELYSKESIVSFNPDLKNFINRVDGDLFLLEQYKTKFIDKLTTYKFNNEKEYKYPKV